MAAGFTDSYQSSSIIKASKIWFNDEGHSLSAKVFKLGAELRREAYPLLRRILETKIL
jgi:hypothetical protein